MMPKLLVFISVALLVGPASGRAEAFDHAHRAWGAVLEKVVDDRGRVDYALLKGDSDGLYGYLSMLASVTPAAYRAWSREQQMACLINLYNAQTIELVLRYYPVKSIKDIGSLLRGPWGQPVVSWFGTSTTLDYLQHQLIGPLFTDARAHLALVCAASSAPPLRNEPYLAERLDQQLDDQVRRFLADPSRNRIDLQRGTFAVSRVFEWQAAEFIRDAGSVELFIRRALAVTTNPPVASASASGTLTYLDFDWTLNDRRPVAP